MAESLNRRAFCAAAAAAAVAQHAGGAARRPNVLLITGDDLGPQLGCYGDPAALTPHCDRLAREGTRFATVWVSQASCSPSRSTIFTGRFPHQNGQLGLSHRGYAMPRALPTIPSLLGAAGYRTGVIGKIHTAPEPPFEFRRTNAARTRDPRTVAADAREFLAGLGDAPFFLKVSFVDPHRPLLKQHAGLPDQPLEPGEAPLFDWLPVDTPACREEVANYHNCNRRLDFGVGLLLDELTAAGRLDETLIILIGDHGPPFTRAKTTCYESGLRIPLIVRWPGHAVAGAVSQRLSCTADLLPTICEATGCQAPGGLPGSSLLPALRGDGGSPPYLFAEHHSHTHEHWMPRRAVRDRRFKLIRNLVPGRRNPLGAVDGCSAYAAVMGEAFAGTPVRAAIETAMQPPEWELYDLESDPVEYHNRADDPAHAATLTRLRVALDGWRRRTDDPFLDSAHTARLTAEHDAPEAADG